VTSAREERSAIRSPPGGRACSSPMNVCRGARLEVDVESAKQGRRGKEGGVKAVLGGSALDQSRLHQGSLFPENTRGPEHQEEREKEARDRGGGSKKDAWPESFGKQAVTDAAMIGWTPTLEKSNGTGGGSTGKRIHKGGTRGSR